MRSFDVTLTASGVVAAALVCAGVPACATPLPGGDLGATDTASDAGAPPLPIATGCLPFRSIGGLTAVTGALRSLSQADGGTLFVVDDGTVNGADVPNLALMHDPGAKIDDCLAAASFLGGKPTSALDPPVLSPLAGVRMSGQSVLYYVDTSGATGVAAQDATDGRFRPGPSLLWTSDRPSYGTAVVLDGANVDVLGCRSARFLDADCFAARVPATAVSDESMYAYYTGGGHWSPRVDDAWPMTTGPASFDVIWEQARERWLMVFVGPLGDTILVRSGLTPEGPWSAPVPVATCDLADADMFCAGVHVHATVASPPNTIVVSYARASFSADVGSRKTAEPLKWWPRVAAVTLPPLP